MIAPFTTYPRTALGIVGIFYLALGIVCSIYPAKMGDAMGYTFKGNGIIEFVVIYGGMEIGFGLAMLVAVVNRAIYPGVYFMALAVSLALPIARTGMFLPLKIDSKAGPILIIELAILAALIGPFLRRGKHE